LLDKLTSAPQISKAPTGLQASGNAKVMHRYDLTCRLVAKLKCGEAVIGGIGNTNFDLWASGQRPENYYMLNPLPNRIAI
jgi:hypothetical protein